MKRPTLHGRANLCFSTPVWFSFVLSILFSIVSAQTDAPSVSQVPSFSPSNAPTLGDTNAPTVAKPKATVAPTVQASQAPSTSSSPTVKGFTGELTVTNVGWVVSTDKGTPIYTADTLPEEAKTEHSNAYEAVVNAALSGLEQGVEYIVGSAKIMGYIDSDCPDQDVNAPATKNCMDVIAEFKVTVVNRVINDLATLPNAVHQKIDDGSLQAQLDNIFSNHPLDVLEGYGPTNTLAPTVTASAQPTAQPTASLSPSFAPSISSKPTAAPTKSAEPSISVHPSMAPSLSSQPSNKPTVSARPSVSMFPSLTPSISQVPSASPSKSHSPTTTMPPSLSPSISILPSGVPSLSGAPSQEPSIAPSGAPSTTGAPTRTLYTGNIEFDIDISTENTSGLEAYMMSIGILYSQLKNGIEALVFQILDESSNERLLQELALATSPNEVGEEPQQHRRRLPVEFLDYKVTLAQDTDCPADAAENTNCVNFYGTVVLNVTKEVRAEVEGPLQEGLQKAIDDGKLQEELQLINRFFPLTIISSDPATSAPSTTPSVTPEPDEGMGLVPLIGLSAGLTALLACCGGASYYFWRRRRARLAAEQMTGVQDGEAPPMDIQYDKSKQPFPEAFDDEPDSDDEEDDADADVNDPLSTFKREQIRYPDVFGDGPSKTFGTSSPSTPTDDDDDDSEMSSSDESDDDEVVQDLDHLRTGHGPGAQY